MHRIPARTALFLAFLAGCAPPPPAEAPSGGTPPPSPGETAEPGPPRIPVRTVAGSVGVAGLGPDGADALDSPLYWPVDVVIDPDGQPVVMDFNNHRVRLLGADGGVTTILASELTGGLDEWLERPTDAAFGPDGRLYLVSSMNVHRVDLQTHEMVRLCYPTFGDCTDDEVPRIATGVAFDPEGRLLVADIGRGEILRLDAEDHLTVVAGTGVPGWNGDGPALETQLFRPYVPGLRSDFGARMTVAGHVLYVADTGNNRVRAIDLDTWMVTTVAGDGFPGFEGDGGPATEAEVMRPADVAVGPDGAIYLPDWRQGCVRVVRDGVIDTFAGRCGEPGYADADDAREARFDSPFGVAVAADGGVYVADTLNQVVRLVGP